MIGPFAGAPPIDIARGPAADAAREELTKHIYTREEPGAIWRALSWLRERFAELLGVIGDSVPAGRWALLILPILIIIVIAIIRWRVGSVAGGRAAVGPVFFGPERTAVEHRANADAAAARKDFATACRERFRALVKDLEERTILDPRPGRTADETAREIAALSAEAAAPVATAARVFDEIHYGGRTPTAAADGLIRDADDAARRVRGLSTMTP